MDINIPTAQFEKTFHPTMVAGWKRTFMRSVTEILILHDRTKLAKAEPTNDNIVRAICSSIEVGGNLQFYTHIDKCLTSKKFPKKWETLVNDEANRIMDEEELANKETL